MSDEHDNWDFYFGRVDGAPSSTFVNLSLGARAPVAGYADCIYISLAMNTPRDDGLSSSEEFDRLTAIEESLTDVITVQNGIFAGRVTHDGMRDFFAYFRDGGTAKEALLAFQATFPDYRMEIGTRTDPNWDIYTGYLFPRPAPFQHIWNRRLCHKLSEQGDHLTLPRMIDHLARFPDPIAAAEFAKVAPEIGFAVEAITGADDDGAFSVQFNREDTPATIDGVTDQIISALEAAVGVYDGWRCAIQRRH